MQALGHVCACLYHLDAWSRSHKLVARSDQPQGRLAQASRSSAACALFQRGFGACGTTRKKAGAGNTPHFFLSHSPRQKPRKWQRKMRPGGKRPAVSSTCERHLSCDRRT